MTGKRIAGQPSRRRQLAAVGLWTFLGLSLAAIGLAATGACGLALPWSDRALLTFCPRPTAAGPLVDRTLQAERAREEALRRRLGQLRLTLAAAPDCPAAPQAEPPVQVAEAPPEPPPQAEPEPEPEPEPAPEPEPEEPPAPDVPMPQRRPTAPPRPPPPTPPPAPPQAQDIPEQAWDNRDLSFLEGCWTLISDYRLRDVDTGQITGVRSWTMCFRPDGGGSQTLVFDNGVSCSAPVQAAFSGGGLTINDQADVQCQNRFRIFRRVISCRRLPDGTAQCDSRQPGRGEGGSRVLFRR